MPNNSSPIVLIHGLWMTALCWEEWIAHYTAKGHRVIAKSWPGMDVGIDELGAIPPPLPTLESPKSWRTTRS